MSEDATTTSKGVTRREFLYYAWFSSMALFMAGSGGATLAYAFPRFKEGEFGGKFVVGKTEEFEDGSVTPVRNGKFFLVRQGDEYMALYQVCTHLGCLVRETEQGFSCPCHGSKFAKDGTLVASPAPRDMDEFAVEIVDGNVIVDTGNRIKGESRSV
jgi:nitrite reductase/ring-hydroxylating ferredoxin subunit